MSRVIVFTRTKHGADKVVRHLHVRGIRAEAIHGNKSQNARQRALDNFRSSKLPVLVATDIASRGIDIDDISHVVNFDVPRTPEDYVHRIGRTGRMEAAGDAYTLVSPEDRKEVEAIEKAVGMRPRRLLVPDFNYDLKRDPEAGRDRDHDRDRRGGRRGARDAGSRGAPRTSHAGPPAAPAGETHGRRRRINPTDRRSRKRM